MLKPIVLALSILFLKVAASGQTIKENIVDEFTKNKVVRTSWEPLAKVNRFYAHSRVSKINDNVFLDLKIMIGRSFEIGGSIFSIKDGPYIMFKLENDSVVTLTNPKYEIACQGCGAVNLIGSSGYGVNLKIPIDEPLIEHLSSHKVTKIRIYTTDGYVEEDIKEKFRETVLKELKLIKSI
jgi:hypothetical protein